MIYLLKSDDYNKKKELCEKIMGLTGDYEVEVRKPPKKKSTQMMRYYGGVVLATLSNSLGYDKEEMHDLLKSMFLKEVHELPDGSTTMRPRRVRDLTEKEMIDYIEEIKRWAAQEFSIVIPDSEQ